MADTVYTDGVTLLTADTMNDLNRLHYTILGDPADDAAVISGLGITATIAELNHAAGVTSAIQTQLNAKIGKDLSGETGKTTPVDADLLALSDSAASFGLKKLTWANLKATAKTYFDGLYASLAGSSGQAFSASSPTSEFNVINVNRMRTRSDMFNVTTNTSTAYVLSPSIPLSGLVDGLAFSIQPHVNCGASPTINISGLGNINIVKETRDGTYVNLVADDLRQYHNYNLIYNATVAKYVLQKVALSSNQGIGYITGDGGEVTQLTNKSTTVTLNKPTGKITTSNAALGANTAAIFEFSNSILGANDTVVLSIKSGFATNATYRCWAEEVVDGACKIVIENRSTGSLSEAIVINYSIIKGSIS